MGTDAERKKFDMLVKGVLGKTMNVYTAQPNTNQNFLKTYRIISVKTLGSIGTKVIFTVDDNESHGRTDLVKTCGRKAFENANAVGGKNRFLYSDKLNDLLEKHFCTRSKGGSVVPTADFASADLSSDLAAMTEGKKIVRLTESELVELVKKVLKEQSAPPMDDAQKKIIEKCFMENLDMNDLSKVPTCSALAFEMLKTKRLPTDMQKGMKCANEISAAVGDDPFTAFAKLTQVGQCLIGQSAKPPSPVKF